MTDKDFSTPKGFTVYIVQRPLFFASLTRAAGRYTRDDLLAG